MTADMLAKLQALWAKPPSEPTETPPRISETPTKASPSNLQARLQAAWVQPRTNTNPQIRASATLPEIPTAVPVATDSVAAAPQPVFIDFETQSHCDIRNVGGRRYAQDPSTRLVSLVAFIDAIAVVWIPNHDLTVEPNQLWPDQISQKLPVSLFSGAEFPEVLADAIRAGRPLCAHNAFGFDAFVWRAKGLPQPSAWIDTLPMARAAGLPGRLDELGLRLFGIGKDSVGSKVLREIMKPGKDDQLPAITPNQLAQVVSYNIQDVALLVGVHTLVNGCGEPEVIRVDTAINERGIAFDCELAAKLVKLEAASVEPVCRAMEVATGGAVKRSDLTRVQFLGNWLRDHGVELENLRRETVEQFLVANAEVNPVVRGVLEARLANSRITTSKLENAIEACDSDGRLRDLIVYHGAHTGRWAGRGMQPHNLPRPKPQLEDLGGLLSQVDNLAAFQNALPAGVSVTDGLSALIRPCFRASQDHVLVIADFAGIEARGVVWCADDQEHLDLFTDGADSYCDLANQIFGYEVTRANKRECAVGKVAVLGCGYGLGAESFGRKCVNDGVDLVEAKTSAEIVVEAYRDAYSKVAGVKNSQGWREGGLWKDLEHAARLVIQGRGPVTAGKCTFRREGKSLVVVLPSGRRMYYQNARFDRSRNRGDGDANYKSARLDIVFDGSRATNVTTYGGKLTENVVSAICRDLLAASLVQCEREGLAVVLHVHDEIVLEVPTSQAEVALRRLLVIMSTPPPWADGFPIEVEGFWAERYCKAPPSGSKSLRGRQGDIL